jgi:hypothetical protein
MMNWKEFGRRLLYHNYGNILEFVQRARPDQPVSLKIIRSQNIRYLSSRLIREL